MITTVKMALLPGAIRDLDALLPELPKPFLPRWEVYSPPGKVRHRVGLFTGCVMPLVYGPVHEATREDLLAYLNGKIAKWWMPDDVVFVDEIPHTATGKIQKMTLRERFGKHRLPTVAA